MPKTCAVIPSTGIGDALLMMVASHSLKKGGYEVTTYHPKFHEMQAWFGAHQLKPSYTLTDLQAFDLVICQNNNSERVQELIAARENGSLKRLSIFYPSHKEGKNSPLTSEDQLFDPNLTMVENISRASATLIDAQPPTKENGLIPLQGLTHRLSPQRIVIQPLTAQIDKNWPHRRFLKLAQALAKRGFHPTFALTHEQKANPQWSEIPFETIAFDTLSDLAEYIYESGFVIGGDSLLPHLASNLDIPHLVITKGGNHVNLWQPGWLRASLVTPPSWAPNFKFLRSREKHWKQWIRVKDVLRGFDDLLCRE